MLVEEGGRKRIMNFHIFFFCYRSLFQFSNRSVYLRRHLIRSVLRTLFLYDR